MGTFKERIKEFAAYQGLTVKGLQDALGLSNAHFSNTTTVTPRVAKKIKELYPDANIGWLNFGQGTMLVGKDLTDAGDQTIPLLPMSGADSIGSYIMGSGDNCERILSPIRNVQVAISITDDSMAPEYPSGCVVLVASINGDSFIEWGKVFALETANGIVVRKVLPSPTNKEMILCRAVNLGYPDFEIAKSDIRGWYVVRFLMQRK